MKKVLFYYSQLNIGGAEKSIIRLMNAFIKRGDKVDYLGRYSGGTGEYLLDNSIKKYWLSQPLSQRGRVRQYISMARGLVERVYSTVSLKARLGSYDVAFVGLQGLSPEWVIRNIKVSRICVFIRSDISRAKQKAKIVDTLRRYVRDIDYFICVADSVRNSLVKEIPETKQKAIVVYNILAVDYMKHQLTESEDPFAEEKENIFRIVTVCRISDSSKALFRMIRVCRRLINEGFKFRWYVVGDGLDLPAFRQSITEKGLTDIMITPGQINNPFGYYRSCNLVAMLSYYEGLCGVVNEAKVAGKAIIATEVSGIHEQLEHGVNGWIVDNDEEKIFEGMKYLLENENIVQKLTNTIYPRELTDDEAKIEKLYNLIG